MVPKGADIEARDFNLWMPLDCAAAYGRPKCAKMLLEAGASVDPVDKVGTFFVQFQLDVHIKFLFRCKI